jgi:hypothetical protein
VEYGHWVDCVHTRNEQQSKAPGQNLGKLDGPILSGSTAVRGAAGLQWHAPPLAKRRLDGGDA